MSTTDVTTLPSVAAVAEILAAHNEGCPALLVTGRSLYDLVLDREGKLRPLLEALRREVLAARGLHVITYSLASGFDWDQSQVANHGDCDTMIGVLRRHQLLEIPQDQNEVVRVLRGISSLVRSRDESIRWADGRPMRFLFLCEFTEHLAPGALANGTQTDAQLAVIELATQTAQSLALRTGGHLIVFHGRDGMVDPLVAGALRHVRLRQPDAEEKTPFIAAALGLYHKARLESGLTADAVARIARNTPNRSQEEMLRASHFTGAHVTARAVANIKSGDIERLSEGSLAVIDASRVEGLRLEGRNIETPRRVLLRIGAGLRRGDATVPTNVLLCGAPGTGKTDLAIVSAVAAGTAAYQLYVPKSPWVGETERRARLQQRIIDETAPCVAFCDEISEALPLQRSDFDGDSGASRAVMATLLTALSDESRRGRSVIIGSTNRPDRIGDAMLSRFVVVPVLLPLAEDLPAIVAATSLRVKPSVQLDPADRRVVEAARVFSEKGASARDIRQSLAVMAMLREVFGPDDVLAAARDLMPRGDRVSAVYADLLAIAACSARAFLPWSDAPQSYPYPSYLENIVDPQTGDVNRIELQKRLNELRPLANV